MSTVTNIANTLPRSAPDLKLLLTQVTRELSAGLAVAQTATINAFYPATQTADVQVNMSMIIQYLTDDNGNNQPVTASYPPFNGIPVVTLGGGGGAVTFPIQAGDQCLLVFIDRDLDNWWLSGQQGLPPNTTRLHNLSDAVAIVGLRSKNNSLSNYSTTDTQLYGPAGTTGPLISLDNSKVGISNNATSLLTVMNDIITALTALNAKSGPNCSTQINAAQSAITSLLK